MTGLWSLPRPAQGPNTYNNNNKMKPILLILMITQRKVLLNSFAVYGEKKLLDLKYVKLLKPNFVTFPV